MQLHTLSFDAPSAPTGPTLLCLPGLSQSAEQFVEISGLREVATELGRRVVFAQAPACVWNFWRPVKNPCLEALCTLVHSLAGPAPGVVDMIGFSAGASAIYSYLAEFWGNGAGVGRVVSYAGEYGFRGDMHPTPGTPVLILHNACDELVDAAATSGLQGAYMISGCPVTRVEVDPPQPWPDYPGARLGHFWSRALVNPQIVNFLGAP